MSLFEPTDEEAMEGARVFDDAAAATDADTAATLLAVYLGDDPEVGYAKLWGLLSTGGLLVAASIKKRLGPQYAACGIAIDGKFDEHDRAAVQLASCHLVGDPDAAADVIAAHLKTAGLAGLFELLTALVGVYRRVRPIIPGAG